MGVADEDVPAGAPCEDTEVHARRSASAGGQDLPADLAPFWGDPASPAAEFDAALDRLLAENSGTSIQVVEGTRGIAGDPAGGEVRITVEQPYVDLNRMEIVDRTRIVLVNLSERE